MCLSEGVVSLLVYVTAESETAFARVRRDSDALTLNREDRAGLLTLLEMWYLHSAEMMGR